MNRLAEKWLKSKEAAGYWKENKRGSRDVRLRLSKYILPNFGDREIASISAKEIADAFKEPISEHKGRILQVIGNLREIFNWAIAMGLIPPMMNPADMRGPLGVLLAPWLRYAKPRDNLGALPFREIPSFIEELFNLQSQKADLLIFGILTASRSQAVRLSRWNEFDLQKKQWVIPYQHDKIKTLNRDRTIYLSEQAILILRRVKKANFENCSGESLVFPKNNNMPFSGMDTYNILTLLQQKRIRENKPEWIDPEKTQRKGKKCLITFHGTASAGFRTWAKSDELGNNRKFDQEAVELCLLHSKNDQYHGAYDRARLET